MTIHIERSMIVNIPSDKIWETMNDFGGIEKYAPTITSSPIINDIKSGLGAKRKCTFNDGSSMVEEIIEFNEGQGYSMVLTEFSAPLNSMHAEVRVKKIDANSSELYMSADVETKSGPLGWLMGNVLMPPIMKGVFKKVMSGLAYYSATQNEVAEKLPSNDVLAKIIVA